MKTMLYSTLAVTITLVGCLLFSLIRAKRTKKDQKTALLVVPVCILLLFVGLFIGAGISHSQLRKELVEMKETGTQRNDDARLTVLEKRYHNLSRIIGRDSETEQLISDLQMKR